MAVTLLAFNSCTLLDKFPVKIECIECWGSDKLLLTTAEGSLLVYEVKKGDDAAGPAARAFYLTMKESQKNFAKKSVTQMICLDDFGLLVTLSDQVYVYDLPSFNQRPGNSLQKTKGCTCFCVTLTDRYGLALCAGIKKHIMIYSWDGSQFTELKDIQHTWDTPHALAWCDQNICIGFKRDYCMLNSTNWVFQPLQFGAGKSLEPIITQIPDNQLLLARDSVGVFISVTDGQPTRKHGVAWTDAPVAVTHVFPYVIGLLKTGVEVRTLTDPCSIVQVIGAMKAAKCVCMSTKDKTATYVATPASLFRLIPVPIPTQVDQLISDHQFESALTLCDSITDDEALKQQKIAGVKVSQAYHMFSQGRFTNAMTLFLELNVSVLEVLGLFTNLLPAQMRGKHKYTIDVPELIGVARDKAIKALALYLNQVRQKNPPDPKTGEDPAPARKGASPEDYAYCTDIATIVDTTLLKVCVQANDDAQLAALLAAPNFCHILDCERFLLECGRLVDLIDFYRNKELHVKALKLLEDPSKGLTDPAHVIKYLKNLGANQIDLILQYSTRVLTVNPKTDGKILLAALEIFTNSGRNPELPAARVLKHIKATAPSLVVPFLECLISRGDKTPDFHNELIEQYKTTILALKAGLSGPTSADSGLLGTTRTKLLNFLESSKCYKAEKMLSNVFPNNDLFEERAILLSRIGDHRSALNIYAHVLKDTKKAEQYCEQHYNEDTEDGRDVYLSLLDVYLRPQEGEPFVKPAMDLLNRHYIKIDIPKALQLLPPNTPLADLRPFFENVLRDTGRRRRAQQIMKNLLKSENLQVKEQAIYARSRVIKVDEFRQCPACSRPLRLSAFASFPDGSIVHLMCLPKWKQNAAHV